MACGKLKSCAVLDQFDHSISMQPKQPHGQLAQIVSVRANRQTSRPTQCVGGLSFQR
jgi:hypothetical protein